MTKSPYMYIKEQKYVVILVVLAYLFVSCSLLVFWRERERMTLSVCNSTMN